VTRLSRERHFLLQKEVKDKTYSPQEEGDANGIRFEVLADSTLSAPIARIAVNIAIS
jgi:hypothetical protein